MMRIGFPWVIRLLAATLLFITIAFIGLWVATSGTYTVPALVTDDASLPAAEIAGHRLHLRKVQGPPGAGTIIVLHGGPGADFRSLTALEALSETSTVVFYDQRGAGLSERVTPDALTLDGYLSELAPVIEHVAPSADVTLIGHSWGAMLAAAYLGRYPERVKQAVLIEPGYLDASGRTEWQETSRSFMSGPRWWATGLVTGFRAARVEPSDPHARDDFLIGTMVASFANHPGNAYHCGGGYDAPGWRFGALASRTWDTAPSDHVDRISDHTAAYGGPVLLMAGACNTWLGEALQSRHLKRFQNARLAVIDHAGHNIIWDNPKAALEAIRTFLQTSDAL